MGNDDDDIGRGTAVNDKAPPGWELAVARAEAVLAALPEEARVAFLAEYRDVWPPSDPIGITLALQGLRLRTSGDYAPWTPPTAEQLKAYLIEGVVSFLGREQFREWAGLTYGEVPPDLEVTITMRDLVDAMGDDNPW